MSLLFSELRFFPTEAIIIIKNCKYKQVDKITGLKYFLFFFNVGGREGECAHRTVDLLNWAIIVFARDYYFFLKFLHHWIDQNQKYNSSWKNKYFLNLLSIFQGLGWGTESQVPKFYFNVVCDIMLCHPQCSLSSPTLKGYNNILIVKNLALWIRT